jgi:hypothetical protein
MKRTETVALIHEEVARQLDLLRLQIQSIRNIVSVPSKNDD